MHFNLVHLLKSKYNNKILALLIGALIICILIFSNYGLQRLHQQNMHAYHIQRTSKYITAIKHQNNTFVSDIKSPKDSHCVKLQLAPITRATITQGYPLYLENIELNRETQYNKKIHITNNFSIKQSQILSHFNDYLALLNNQQQHLSRISNKHLVTNNAQLNHALYISKESKKLPYIPYAIKQKAQSILYNGLNHHLFTQHIIISRNSDIIQVKALKSTSKKAIPNHTNYNYQTRNKIYQNILQNMINIQQQTKNPFIIIKVTNI